MLMQQTGSELVEELVRLQSLAEKQIDQVYDVLETLCICFPGRLTGSETLERSLDYLFQYGTRELPQTCCCEEIVPDVPRWIRSHNGQNESCVISIRPQEGQWPVPHPLQRHLHILANGLSTGTPEEGLNGPLIIVHSFEELHERGMRGELQGTIVLFDFGSFEKYELHAAFRSNGAIEAARYGVHAVLVRSLTPNSSCSGAHTGTQQPAASRSIPSATISIEDTEMLTRLVRMGYRDIVVDRLVLPCVNWKKSDRNQSLPNSRNLLFELKGSERPEEIVLLGAHTDCWDCANQRCQGAHDDAQGVVIILEIVRLLHSYGFVPKRTIRAVLFVDEEIAQRGAQCYRDAHIHEAEHVIAAIETDLGVGPVCGFGFSGNEQGRKTLSTLLSDTLSTSALHFPLSTDAAWSGKGVDIGPLIEQDGVPGLLLRHADSWWHSEYFHMHHSASDTIDHVDKHLLLQNFTVLLTTSWALANSDVYLR